MQILKDKEEEIKENEITKDRGREASDNFKEKAEGRIKLKFLRRRLEDGGIMDGKVC